MSSKPTRSLKQIAQNINKEHEQACGSALEAIEHVQAAGRMLLEVKERLQHGEFTPWVEKHCKVKIRQARNYMRVAEIDSFNIPEGEVPTIKSLLEGCKTAPSAVLDGSTTTINNEFGEFSFEYSSTDQSKWTDDDWRKASIAFVLSDPVQFKKDHEAARVEFESLNNERLSLESISEDVDPVELNKAQRRSSMAATHFLQWDKMMDTALEWLRENGHLPQEVAT